MESAQRRHDQKADDSPGRLLRLVARKVHARSTALPRGSRSLSASLSRRADLSGPLYRQLVPALPDCAERPRDSSRGPQGAPLAHSLSGGGWSESIVVATTRPETMLGDTAVAVNPEDE